MSQMPHKGHGDISIAKLFTVTPRKSIELNDFPERILCNCPVSPRGTDIASNRWPKVVKRSWTHFHTRL